MQSYSSVFQKVLKKILLYGLPILYFLIAVSFYLKTYDSAQIKITIFHIGGLFLIMTWLISKIESGNFNFFKNTFIFLIPVILYFISGIISFSISPFKYASLNELIKRFIYCGLVLIIIDEFNDEKKILKIINWLVAAGYIVCIYGLIQFFDYQFFPPPPATGLDPFLWRQAFANRIFSTFGNPNFFGDFLIVMNPILLASYLYKRRFYIGFLWVLTAICTVFTFSKGAWLGFAAGTFAFILIYVLMYLTKKLNKKILVSTIIISVLIVAIAFLGVFVASKKRTDSISFRLFTWLSTWEMINTNPVLGTGIGSFYVTYPAWRRPQIFFIEGKHNTESDHPENEYLEVWFDEGIIGLTLFLLLIMMVFTAGFKNISFLNSGNNTRDGPLTYIQLGVLAAFTAKLVHDTVCVSLRFVSSGVMLWLLIGVTISISVILYGKETSSDSKSLLARPVKIILQILVIAVIGYMIFYFSGYFKGDILHSRAIQLSKQSEWDAALSTYGEVEKYNPSFLMSIYFKGNVHLDRWKAGDSIMAERSFKKLWKLAPNYVQSKYLAGVMYSRLWENAVIARNKAINDGADEKSVAKLTATADDYFAKSEKYYNEYMMIDPIYNLNYYGLASLYAKSGNIDKALSVMAAHISYPEKLKEYPHSFWVEDWESRRQMDYSETYMQMAILYTTYGMNEKARDLYIKSIELMPKRLDARKNLAVTYERLGDREKSKEEWRTVYNIDPKDPDAIAYLQSMGEIPKQ